VANEKILPNQFYALVGVSTKSGIQRNVTYEEAVIATASLGISYHEINLENGFNLRNSIELIV